MIPVFKRPKDILAWGVVPTQEPHVGHAKELEGPASFEDTHLPQRGASFVSNPIGAPVADGAEDCCHALVLIENGSRQIASDNIVVIRVGNNQ